MSVQQRGGAAAAMQPPTQSSDVASVLFDQFCSANTFLSILDTFRQLCDVLELKPGGCGCSMLRQVRTRLASSWKAQTLWTKLDKRASHWEYKNGSACVDTRVFVIGAGPCGLRVAIEIALLGGRVVIVEKRDSFSRNNVLHLWPHLIHDLKVLGAKKFFGKFCAGSIDHISIRTLQCILLKVALLVGVEVHAGVSFESLVEPPVDQTVHKVGWRAKVIPEDHPVSEYSFDVCISADGKRNTLQGFNKKEFRGKLAIAITANFINRNTQAEASVEEISGVSYIFNQRFFKDLNTLASIDLENIVYYKDETHYFVMTAKKHSLLYRGVLRQDDEDPQKLLAKDNVNQEALLEYAREAANIATRNCLPNLEYAHNHYGQPDVAMFDFTSMYAAEHACRVVERRGYRLLVGLVGDTLLEPFWPIGSGCARGFLGALDTAWMVRSWASAKMTPLEVIAERESIYQLLSQTTPENLNKSFAQHTIDPNTRYRNVNVTFFKPHQVREQYDGTDTEYVNEIVRQSEQKGKRYDWLRDSHNLLKWFQRQLEPYRNLVKVIDLTTSWRNGLALCALIHLYRPHLIDVYILDPGQPAANSQLAFDVAAKEFGIHPVMTGYELVNRENLDKAMMVSYLALFYEFFRKESIEREAGLKMSRVAALGDVDTSVLQKKEDLEIGGTHSLKRIQQRAGVPGVPSKRLRDILGNENLELPQYTSRSASDVLKEVEVGVRGQNKVSALAKDLATKFQPEVKRPEDQPKPVPMVSKPLIFGKAALHDLCYFCKKQVYVVERYTLRGIIFHRNCLKCDYCSTVLRVSNYSCQTTDSGEYKFYCVQHSGLQKLPVSRPPNTTSSGKPGGRDVQDFTKYCLSPPRATGRIARERAAALKKTPERAEYTTESEVEESELDQTRHNLRCELLRPTAYTDSSSSSEEELQFSDDDDASEEMPDVTWQEVIRRSYGQRLAEQSSVVPERHRTSSGTDTETVGGASNASDADWETDAGTECDDDLDSKQQQKSTALSALSPQQTAATSVQPKSSPSTAEIMRNRMAFFSAPSQPVRINAHAFLGLAPDPPSAVPQPSEEPAAEKPAEASEDKTEESAAQKMVVAGDTVDSSKLLEPTRKKAARKEPPERTKRWRKRRKKRPLTGQVAAGGSIAEKHDALPVVAIEGASTGDEDEITVTEHRDSAVIITDQKKDDVLSTPDSSRTKSDSSSEHAEGELIPDQLEEFDSPAVSDSAELQGACERGERMAVSQESAEEVSNTLQCDEVEESCSSESEFVEELAAGDAGDDEEDVSVEDEALVDGRTIHSDKLFAEELDVEGVELDACEVDELQELGNNNELLDVEADCRPFGLAGDEQEDELVVQEIHQLEEHKTVIADDEVTTESVQTDEVCSDSQKDEVVMPEIHQLEEQRTVIADDEVMAETVQTNEVCSDPQQPVVDEPLTEDVSNEIHCLANPETTDIDAADMTAANSDDEKTEDALGVKSMQQSDVPDEGSHKTPVHLDELREIAAIKSGTPQCDSDNVTSEKYASAQSLVEQTETEALPVVRKLAPKADVDSFSEDDFEMCVDEPSEPFVKIAAVTLSSKTDIEEAAVMVTTPQATCLHWEKVSPERHVADVSDSFSALVESTIDESVNLSEIVAANLSQHQEQLEDETKPAVASTSLESALKDTVSEGSNQSSDYRKEVDSEHRLEEIMASEDKHIHSLQASCRDLRRSGGESQTTDVSSFDRISTVSTQSPSQTRVTPVLKPEIRNLDPLSRIDLLLESLSSSKVGLTTSMPGTGRSLNVCKDMSEDKSPKAGDSYPLSDDANSTREEDVSRIVEFRVADESGAELSFMVDETFVSERDVRRQHASDKESSSDGSFSGADRLAGCQVTDESSSSDHRQAMSCPAEIAVPCTDDSISLDHVQSFSFDDSLSADNVLDMDDGSHDLADDEGERSEGVSHPYCNGSLDSAAETVAGKQNGKPNVPVLSIVLEDSDVNYGVQNGRKNESPVVPVLSPHRLIDAKRRFFCEAPQPLRIDPRRLFDDIPTTCSASSSSNRAGGISSEKLLNGSANTKTSGSLNVPLPSATKASDTDSDAGETQRRRLLPAVPANQAPVDASKLVISADDVALFKAAQQQRKASLTKNMSAPDVPPTASEEHTEVPSKPERRRPSSALIVTCSELSNADTPATATVKVPQQQKVNIPTVTHSDSMTDGSPNSKRRDREGLMWAFHRPKSKTKPAAEPSMSDPDSVGTERKEKKRSLFSLLMPSKSADKREKLSKESPPVLNPATASVPPLVVSTDAALPGAAQVDASGEVKRVENVAVAREKTKSLPLDKKKSGASSLSEEAKRASLEKRRAKSSKSAKASKKSDSDASNSENRPATAGKQPQRTVYEEMAPIIEGIKRVEKRNREKASIHERIQAVAPPPAKAPNTVLLPPKADIEDFETESEFGDDRVSLRSYHSQILTSPEDAAKHARRQQRAARRKQREKELCRMHIAQEIQRQLEVIEQTRAEVEQRGIRIEKALRGEESPNLQQDETSLMQEWFNVVHEKNCLAGYESELFIHSRELELEDRQSRLESQLRERIAPTAGTDRKPSLEEEERRILEELMEVVKQRDALVSLLEEDRLKQQQYDKNLERIMSDYGFIMTPITYIQELRQPLSALSGSER